MADISIRLYYRRSDGMLEDGVQDIGLDPKIAHDIWMQNWLLTTKKAEAALREINYNHRHVAGDGFISGASDGYILTAKDMRDAIANLPDDAEIIFGTCDHGQPLQFGRFKTRGENLLTIEFG